MINAEILGLLILVLSGWFWFDSLKTREAGVRAVRSACEAEGLQLLDETIAIVSLKPARDGLGRIALRRIYAFEYSDCGSNRRRGSVHLLGTQVELLNLGLRLVPAADRVLH
jgi:hypothetical protein